MSLKDDMAADMSEFFNIDEFAEPHVVAHKRILCVLYELNTSSRDDEGIIPQQWQMQAQRKDLPAVMRAGDTLNIDGVIWIIDAFKEEIGVGVATLTRRA